MIGFERGLNTEMDHSSRTAANQAIVDIVKQVDSFPYTYPSLSDYVQTVNSFFHFRVAAFPDVTLGYMLPSVAVTFMQLPDWSIDTESTPKTITLITGTDAPSRSAAMEKTILAMRGTGHFKILEKWRDELYAVYGPDSNKDNVLFSLERSASQLFGVVTYGVHMTAYRRINEEVNLERDEGLENYKIWVPKRSKTKQTFPGMLDNSVAGGLSAGESIWDSIYREAEEEASLPIEIAKRARAAGSVTYFYVSGEGSGGETGLLQPECQYVFDLDLTDVDVELKPNDSEVESFQLMKGDEAWKLLLEGAFKPNCALVLIDFFIRHGLITVGPEVVSRLHRRLEFPTPTAVGS
jgi:isopentenyldiphosphate isomerase